MSGPVLGPRYCCLSYPGQVHTERCILRRTPSPKGITSMNETYTEVALCPACGNPVDYCDGHGVIGDPVGWGKLRAHDKGDHSACHEAADCHESAMPVNLLTVAEVAEALRVSKMTVYRLIHSHELPTVQVGRSFRIEERAVLTYLSNQRGV